MTHADDLVHAIDLYIATMIDQGSPFDGAGNRAINHHVSAARAGLTETIRRLLPSLDETNPPTPTPETR